MILSAQFFDTARRGQSVEPETALFLAVLEDAVEDYRKYKSSRDPVGKERFQEARAWIVKSGNDWIFSFDNVCDVLGLDAEYLRRGLLGGGGIYQGTKRKNLMGKRRPLDSRRRVTKRI